MNKFSSKFWLYLKWWVSQLILLLFWITKQISINIDSKPCFTHFETNYKDFNWIFEFKFSNFAHFTMCNMSKCQNCWKMQIKSSAEKPFLGYQKLGQICVCYFLSDIYFCSQIFKIFIFLSRTKLRDTQKPDIFIWVSHFLSKNRN